MTSEKNERPTAADETGKTGGSSEEQITPAMHRQLAVRLFNTVWDLLLREDRSDDDDASMIHAAHASLLHWSIVGLPVNLVRGEWQCSRVYAVLGMAEPAMFHAGRCLALCKKHGIGGFDLAASHEAMARACAIAGDADGARRHATEAEVLVETISDAEEKDVISGDLRTLPIGVGESGSRQTGLGGSALA